MTRKTEREKVTFMVPTYLLELADMQADLLGVDRYDVIRIAIGQGLMVLRLNEQMQKDPHRYAEELKAITEGDTESYQRLQAKLGDDTVADVQSQLETRKRKPRRV